MNAKSYPNTMTLAEARPFRTVAWLRDHLRSPNENAQTINRDRLAFSLWCLIAVAYHGAYLITALAILWLILGRL